MPPLPDLLRHIDPRLLLDGNEVYARHGDLHLRTHFQPIYSLSHRRVVGHEALLRARDSSGRPVPPPVVFADCNSLEELRNLDWLCGLIHCGNFANAARTDEWLFLNVHPGTFANARSRHGGKALDLRRHILDHLGLAPHQLVIEVLENAIEGIPEFEAELACLRDMGCLIALDDFGAGHSNFDRVWQLRPDIVKLDRSVIVRAASDRGVRRVTSQMVSMLHECGSLVLMEGIETADEAHIALDSDVDFVQGYYFGYPAAQPVPHATTCAPLENSWELFDERWMNDRNQYRRRIAPYCQAIGQAAAMLAAGRPVEEACADFLGHPEAETCYLLDADGLQVGGNIDPPRQRIALARYSPLRDTRQARWSRRPYFRRALNAFGTVQVTRPYLTMQSSRLCVTVSMSFRRDGQTRIICGDLLWDEGHDVPTFSATSSAATF